MTENDIRATVAILRGSWRAKNDETLSGYVRQSHDIAAETALVALVTQALVDLNRIANAAEALVLEHRKI